MDYSLVSFTNNHAGCVPEKHGPKVISGALSELEAAAKTLK
jgi:hypothetical protein